MVLSNYSTGDKAVYSSLEGGLATDGGPCKMAQLADWPRLVARSIRAARQQNSAERDWCCSVVQGRQDRSSANVIEGQANVADHDLPFLIRLV